MSDCDTPTVLHSLLSLTNDVMFYVESSQSLVPECVHSCASYISRILNIFGLGLNDYVHDKDENEMHNVVDCVLQFRTLLRKR